MTEGFQAFKRLDLEIQTIGRTRILFSSLRMAEVRRGQNRVRVEPDVLRQSGEEVIQSQPALESKRLIISAPQQTMQTVV